MEGKKTNCLKIISKGKEVEVKGSKAEIKDAEKLLTGKSSNNNNSIKKGKTAYLDKRIINASIYEEKLGEKGNFTGKLEIKCRGDIRDVEDGTARICDQLPIGFESQFYMKSVSEDSPIVFKVISVGKCSLDCELPSEKMENVFPIIENNHTDCANALLEALKECGLCEEKTAWSAPTKFGLTQTEKFVTSGRKIKKSSQ